MVELEKLLAQQKEVAATHPPVCMSAAAVTEANLEEMHDLLQNKEFCSPKRLNMLRSMMCEAPLPDPGLPAPAGTAVWARKDPEMPAWAAQVVNTREFLSDCAFVYNVDGTPQYWKMVCMVQSEYHFLFMGRSENMF